jgi:hypothetical protein
MFLLKLSGKESSKQLRILTMFKWWDKSIIIRMKGLIPRLGQSSCNIYNTHGTSHNKIKILFDGQFEQPLKSNCRQSFMLNNSGNSQNILNTHYKRSSKHRLNSKFFLYSGRTVGLNPLKAELNPIYHFLALLSSSCYTRYWGTG